METAQTSKDFSAKVDAFVRKARDAQKQDKMDLSADEDLSIAIMNLVSIEEHFFFTAAKTGKNEYLDLLKEVREMRKELLKKIITDYEGEVWCISKHLLAASMRLMEVGTKQLGRGKTVEAKDLFAKSYQMYALFWGIQTRIIGARDVRAIDAQAINQHDKKPAGFAGKLGELVRKAIDCCIE